MTSLLFEDDEPVEYWLDDVVCDGDEASLFECAHAGLGVHNCKRNERAGVICQGTCKCLCFAGLNSNMWFRHGHT